MSKTKPKAKGGIPKSTIVEKPAEEMKLFNDRKFVPLMNSILNFNNSIDRSDPLCKAVLEFFLQVDAIYPAIRDRSTGRMHVINSLEASSMFGPDLLKVMTNILHKFTNSMTGMNTIVK